MNIAHQIVGCDLIASSLIKVDVASTNSQVMRRILVAIPPQFAGPVERQIGQGGAGNRFVRVSSKLGEIDRVFIDIIQQFHHEEPTWLRYTA